MVDYQTVSIVFAGLSIGLAAIYYMLNLRYTRRNQELQLETRQAQFFMQTYQSVMTSEKQSLYGEVLEWEWTDFDDFSERYYKNPTRKGEWISANMTFDILGIMLKENLMNIEILFEMEQSGTRGGTVLWHKFEPIVREMRKRESNPDLLKNFEYYVEEMYKLRRLKGLSTEWSPENVWWFEK